ncbi:MAG TPA: hypothetical protein DC046_11730 [Rhodospirillaceae bacterium]|nr:hypothetical protein [Rhodospirillaceae bacterium]
MNRSFLSIAATASLALAVVLLTPLGPAQADSKKWRANNHTSYNVKVFWTAQGCAGVEYPCAIKDNNLYEVCETKTLNPGDEKDYTFPDGTSSRKKRACNKDVTPGSDGANLTSTDDRKANEIYAKSDGSVYWVNE